MKRKAVTGLIAGGLVIALVSFSVGYVAHPSTVGHVLPRAPEEWSAAGTWFAVLLAIVAASIAYQQAAEARRLRIEQAQPYVVAYLEQMQHNQMIVELVIKNLGTTAARNVRTCVDRPLRRVAIMGQPGTIERVWLPEGPFFLAPGQEWRTIWDLSSDRLASDELRNEDRHVMTLTYDGVERSGRQENVAILDWAPFKGRIFSEVKSAHHAAKSLADVAQTMKRWTERGRLSVIHRSVGEVPQHPSALEAFRATLGGAEENADGPDAVDEGPDVTGDSVPPDAAQ